MQPAVSRAREQLLDGGYPLPLPATPEDYAPWGEFISSVMDRLERDEKIDPKELAAVRELGLRDLFALIRFMLSTRHARRKDGTHIFDHQFFLDRCRDVQLEVHNVLDLWHREAGKSTIKSFGLVVQRILNNPELAIAIFSHSRPAAKAFLRVPKLEFETNVALMRLFPEVLWENPQKEAPKWSEDDGIILRRKSNRKESTLEAVGIEALTIGKHYDIQDFDDLIGEDEANSPVIVLRTERSWEQALNLGSQDCERWYQGTTYTHQDVYQTIIGRGVVKCRIFPCYEPDWQRSEMRENGTYSKLEFPPRGERKSVFLDQAYVEEKEKSQPVTFPAQMLMDPWAISGIGFKRDDVQYYTNSPAKERRGKRVMILVDPANEKKKGSSFTTMWVVACGADQNLYVIDGIRDRLDIKERGAWLIRLHKKWAPIVVVKYERYGMQVDISTIQIIQEQVGYRFPISEVGGPTSKDDRIASLLPWFQDHRIWFPRLGIHRTLWNNTRRNLVDDFVEEEMTKWPATETKDMLDCLARAVESPHTIPWPDPALQLDEPRDPYEVIEKDRRRGTWQSA